MVYAREKIGHREAKTGQYRNLPQYVIVTTNGLTGYRCS